MKSFIISSLQAIAVGAVFAIPFIVEIIKSIV